MGAKRKKAKARRKQRRSPPRVAQQPQRERLLDAAERIFERNRYEGASVQEIVREAGMSSRSFYQFFASKEDLVVQLARSRAELFLVELASALQDASHDASEGSSDVMETIGRLLQVFLERLPVVVLDLERLGGPPGQAARAVRSEYRRKIQQLIFIGLTSLAERGLIPEKPDRLALELVIAGIESVTVEYCAEGRRDELLALRPRLFIALRALVARLIP